MIFKQLAMAAILFFSKRGQNLHRQVFFIAINIPCKFSEDIFINEGDVKVYVKV